MPDGEIKQSEWCEISFQSHKVTQLTQIHHIFLKSGFRLKSFICIVKSPEVAEALETLKEARAAGLLAVFVSSGCGSHYKQRHFPVKRCAQASSCLSRPALTETCKWVCTGSEDCLTCVSWRLCTVRFTESSAQTRSCSPSTHLHTVTASVCMTVSSVPVCPSAAQHEHSKKAL